MKQIQTNRGMITVPNMKFSRKTLTENGFRFAFEAYDYFGERVGNVWSYSKSATEHEFCIELEPLDRLDVPREVIESVENYFFDLSQNGNDLGQLMCVYRQSNHPDDDYLFGVIARKADKWNCWTSWNQSTKSLNNGHYGLNSYDDAMDILNKYYLDINRED